jgi:hypothetical protein
MSWYAEIDREFDEKGELRKKLKDLDLQYHRLAAANASNIVKAHNIFRCLRHIEFMAEKCPTCGAVRDEDGILAHKKDCYLANTLEYVND